MIPETPEMLLHAVHGDRHLQDAIRSIIVTNGIRRIVETGTYHGRSALWFSSLVCSVDTIEVDADRAIEAERVLSRSGCRVRRGSSGAILKSTISDVPFVECLFYLDAHWHRDWPLRDELKTLNEFRKHGCRFVAIIDDAFVPGRPQFAGCYGGGGTMGDADCGSEPCNYKTFSDELNSWPHLAYPAYPEGGIGYMIVSDFPLSLGDGFEVVS